MNNEDNKLLKSLEKYRAKYGFIFILCFLIFNYLALINLGLYLEKLSSNTLIYVIGLNIFFLASFVYVIYWLKLKEHLVNSERIFRQAIDCSPIGQALVGLDGTWLRVNKSLCNLVGYTQEELLRIDFQTITHEDDLDCDLGYLNRVLEGKISKYQMEKRYYHKQGHIIWVQLNVSLVRDELNKPLYFISQIQDITQRKKYEHELIASEQRLQLVIRATRDGIWDWPDITKEEEYWSLQWKKLIGYEEHEISASASMFFSLLHPDDREYTRKALDNHISFNKPFDVEYRLRTKPGKYKWFQAKGLVSIDSMTGAKRMTGSITDIHSRKKIERNLRDKEFTLQKYLEATYDGYWDWYIQENYEYMSPSFWQMFGFSPDEKRHYPSEWQDLIFEEDLPGVLDNFDKHIRTKGKHPFSQEVRYKHKDGSTVYILCRGSVVDWDRDGKPIRMVGTHTNITEKKKYIDELLQKNAELDDFAYITSHDLKEPLRGISNYSSFLLEDYHDTLDDDGKKILNTLINLTKRMEGQLNDLLHYSRVNRQDIALQPVDLNEVISSIVETMNIIYEKDNVSINVLNKLPTMKCEKIYINELFTNLVVNAIKYNDKRNKIIDIGCDTKYNGLHVFYIKDNGIGIKEKYKDTVFKIFKRLNSRNKYGDGTGFGLTIAKKIVERHSGIIWFESAIGEGTVFYFTLEKGCIDNAQNSFSKAVNSSS